MYARSTTLHGRSGSIDAAIAFVTDEVWPALERTEGCRGLSMLVDRESGHCIATSSWESEDAMRASEPAIHPLRERARDIIGGSMEVDEWEIALMHRTQHGECCRVSWMQGSPGNIEALGETMRVGLMPRLEQTPGFCGASLLIDRSAGLGCATTVWESRAAMEASRPAADDMRNRAASDSASQIADVHEFDLALAHLHVPEMV